MADMTAQQQPDAPMPAASLPAKMVVGSTTGPHSKDAFARLPADFRTIDRRLLNVRVAVRADGTRSGVHTPDPAAVTEAHRRFAICKACEHSRDDGFACDLYASCCLGRFRSSLASHCPADHW